MARSSKSGLWEYTVNLSKLPSGSKKVHFKFIDDNGNWFTDEDYAKEVDEHSNENNVKVFSEDELTGEESEFDVDDEGPESPAPTLEADDSDSFYEPTRTPEIREVGESVGGSAVIVNHSDAEDDESETDETNENALTTGETPYKDVLARIIAFFTNLFRSWFG